MNVIPLAADSLGVRSVATYVECGDTRIVIDPGASLGRSRFNLPPADAEWEALKRANDRISAYATRATAIFVRSLVRVASNSLSRSPLDGFSSAATWYSTSA